MNIPLKITFRNMPPSKAVEANIREKAAKLEFFCDRIMSCRVTVEAPHRHHHKGKAYQVRIDIGVPGGELVINRAAKRLAAAKLRTVAQPVEKVMAERHEPSKHAAHEDIYVTIRDAFNAAGRRLRSYARRQSGSIKVHEPAALARVSKVFPDDGYGFLETPDGREIYFHGNSVLEPAFHLIAIGTKVRYAEEMGDKGPQASMLHRVGRAPQG